MTNLANKLISLFTDNKSLNALNGIRHNFTFTTHNPQLNATVRQQCKGVKNEMK